MYIEWGKSQLTDTKISINLYFVRNVSNFDKI